MVICQGEIWWADLPDPTGSGPGFRRPVLIVQGDGLNFSRLATVVCVPLTSNLRWAEAPANVLLRARATGLPKDSLGDILRDGPGAGVETRKAPVAAVSTRTAVAPA